MIRPKIAVLDDYQNVARSMADWSWVEANADLTIFNDHIADEASVAARLAPFDIVCVMRERTPLTAAVLGKLPNLKLVVSTGRRNASIDAEATKQRGITVMPTGYESTPTIEFTWSLILGVARHVASENASLRTGGWQTQVGSDLRGKTLALLGLGNIGSEVAAIGRAFGMNLIAWSENLTAEKAAAQNAKLVTKNELFEQADFLSIHLVLSPRSRGIVDKSCLSMMKKSAYLINTSRGPLIDEAALLQTLNAKAIAGFAVDVYDQEPLPQDHPFRRLPNVLATPHLGFVSQNLYETFYGDTVKNIRIWMESQ